MPRRELNVKSEWRCSRPLPCTCIDISRTPTTPFLFLGKKMYMKNRLSAKGKPEEREERAAIGSSKQFTVSSAQVSTTAGAPTTG